MKAIGSSLIVIIPLFLQGCFISQKQTDMDFFNCLDSLDEYAIYPSYCIDANDRNMAMLYFYSYLHIEGKEKGDDYLYALPKTEHDVWTIFDQKTFNAGNINNITFGAERKEKAESLLFSQRDRLIKYFDLYVFHTQAQNDEILYVYKYENGLWIETRKENIKDSGIRFFINDWISMILRNRFFGSPLDSDLISQEQEIDIDFLDCLDSSNVWVTSCRKETDKNISIPYFHCEFFLYEMGKGEGCFFAIPKTEYDVWKISDESALGVNNREVPNNEARHLLFFQRDALIKYFDLYVFYVKHQDLMIQGGVATIYGIYLDDYSTKDDATVHTFRYEDGVWIEKGKDNIDGEITRTFGADVVENILRHRFFSILKIK
jgi:hypothetical protein